jgi:hypothetical protein
MSVIRYSQSASGRCPRAPRWSHIATWMRAGSAPRAPRWVRSAPPNSLQVMPVSESQHRHMPLLSRNGDHQPPLIITPRHARLTSIIRITAPAYASTLLKRRSSAAAHHYPKACAPDFHCTSASIWDPRAKPWRGGAGGRRRPLAKSTPRKRKRTSARVQGPAAAKDCGILSQSLNTKEHP